MVIIVLLPKNGGGFRPIGLFPMIARLWMRSRTFLARGWEAANALPCVFGGPGMGAQRAAWVSAFTAEAARLDNNDFIQAFYDLTKAFDTVQWGLLITAAIKHGYPLLLLRLSVAAYRLKRTVCIDGVLGVGPDSDLSDFRLEFQSMWVVYSSTAFIWNKLSERRLRTTHQEISQDFDTHLINVTSPQRLPLLPARVPVLQDRWRIWSLP